MPSNGSSSSPPFTTAGMSVHGVRSDGEFVDRYLRVLYRAICRVRRKIEVQRADMQPFGGFFRERRCSSTPVSIMNSRGTPSALPLT